MTMYLVKFFVKNYEETNRVEVRTAYGVLASSVGIICNILLFLLKIIISVLLNSISIMADAFNNLSDAASSIISLFGIRLAGRPADKEHPFGHGRIEYISALVVSFLILLVGVSLLKNSFEKIMNPKALEYSWILVVFLIISVFVKVWLSLFNKCLGNKINSNVLRATAADARNDVIVTSATIISVVAGNFLGIMIDGWMGVTVSVFVVLAGIGIAKDTLMPLLGEAVDREMYEKITNIISCYDEIIGSHDLIIHNYGPSNNMATIHAEVASDSELIKVHEIIDDLEKKILKETGISIVIHIDPIDIKDKVILESKNIVETIIKQIEPEAHIHDFQVVKDKDTMNLIFDLVVPYSYKETDKEEIVEKINYQLHEINDRYQCEITIENSFMAQ